MYTEIIYLINETLTKDTVGNEIPSKEYLKRYAKLQEVKTREYYSAVAVGLKPTHEFLLRRSEYGGETAVKYNDEEYKVIRSFIKPDNGNEMVLVVERKSGKK